MSTEKTSRSLYSPCGQNKVDRFVASGGAASYLNERLSEQTDRRDLFRRKALWGPQSLPKAGPWWAPRAGRLQRGLRPRLILKKLL